MLLIVGAWLNIGWDWLHFGSKAIQFVKLQKNYVLVFAPSSWHRDPKTLVIS